MTLLARIDEILRAAFPVRDDELVIELVEGARASPDGSVGITLRIVLWESGAIRDLKEQSVCLIPAAHVTDAPRALVFTRAWTTALARIARTFDDVALIMPHDLVAVFVAMLDDATLVGERDLADAFFDANRRRSIERAQAEADFIAAVEAAVGAGDARVAPLVALARPSIEIVSTAAELDACEVGASRQGGHPDLPPAIPWPCHGEQPLTFIAQIELHDVHAAAGEAAAALPARGWLAFFALLEGVPSSEGARGGGHVCFFDGPRDALVRRSPPDAPGAEQLRALPTRAVTFVSRPHAMPTCESPFYVLLDGAFAGPVDVDAWSNAFATTVARYAPLEPYMHDPLAKYDDGEWGPRDRLLGFADALQSDPYVACAMAEGRIPLARWRERATLERAAQWTLLFQADSQRSSGVSYGDGGIVQFFISAADLAARRFDRVWTELQCH